MMIKPIPPKRLELARICRMLGIESNYSLDRLHSTLLPLGESTPTKIEAAHHALRDLDAQPFEVIFDRVEGSTLKPRRGLRAPGTIQRAIAGRLAAFGLSLPAYKFALHMNLAYGQHSDRRAALQPLSWIVDEILLIESVNGQGRHIDRGRWPLIARQGTLPF
ncbi:MAG: hypothetical protein J7500_05800 [Sphingomonas sp.]|uniref:2'-5' RNA ligase family protein n=1 Tax=Sphingomonas sp. TaxID=28214 RepID=UPI001B0C2A97|nr:hypothetical protein [Sphingomonas sp.]MBO9622208.1 hypothetical protein [Sphingomonas sp.]